MPRIINSAEEFEQVKSRASEVRVVRSDKAVKLKLRTPGYLYTYTTISDEADDLIKGLKDVEVIEFGEVKKGGGEEEEKEEKASDKKRAKSVKES